MHQEINDHLSGIRKICPPFASHYGFLKSLIPDLGMHAERFDARLMPFQQARNQNNSTAHHQEYYMVKFKRDAVDALASYFPIFSDPDFSCGEWIASKAGNGETLTLGYFRLSPIANEFYEMLYTFGWVRLDFNWSEWGQSPAGQALLNNHEMIGVANLATLSNLLTVCIRADRFSEGRLENDFRSGLIVSICKRALTLSARALS